MRRVGRIKRAPPNRACGRGRMERERLASRTFSVFGIHNHVYLARRTCWQPHNTGDPSGASPRALTIPACQLQGVDLGVPQHPEMSVRAKGTISWLGFQAHLWLRSFVRNQLDVVCNFEATTGAGLLAYRCHVFSLMLL